MRAEVLEPAPNDLDTGQTYQLTDLLTGVSGIVESSPAFSWSRDGSRIVFSAFSDGGWDLYRLDDPLRLVKEPYVPGEEKEFDLVTRAFVRPSRQRTRPERRRAVAVTEADLAKATEAEGEPPPAPDDEPGKVAADALSKALAQALGPGNHVAASHYTDIYLSAEARTKVLSDAALRKVVIDTLAGLPAIARVFVGEDLATAAARTSSDPVTKAAALSYHAGRSGDFVIVPKEHWLLASSVTTPQPSM